MKLRRIERGLRGQCPLRGVFTPTPPLKKLQLHIELVLVVFPKIRVYPNLKEFTAVKIE
jgi:hypothetical protein